MKSGYKIAYPITKVGFYEIHIYLIHSYLNQNRCQHYFDGLVDSVRKKSRTFSLDSVIILHFQKKGP
jgi:hypothetical protein